MCDLNKLIEQNRKWAVRTDETHPDLFKRLAKGQSPQYLWIGCSDSRVPPNLITEKLPGEIFVHRNIANQVVESDINCMSVLQYAVEHLKVNHVIICGHYGCGGVAAALEEREYGLLDNWIRYIKDVYKIHRKRIDTLQDMDEKHALFCEINVIEQVRNVCQTPIVQEAWKNGFPLTVHGLMYNVADGMLQDLNVSVNNPNEIPRI